MPKRIQFAGVLMLAVSALILTSCTAALKSTNTPPPTDEVLPTVATDKQGSWAAIPAEPPQVTDLQGLVLSSDLIIEGTVLNERTRFIPDSTATKAELADRQARGVATGTLTLDYEVAINQVLRGQVDSTTIFVRPASSGSDIVTAKDLSPQMHANERLLLFLQDSSNDPVNKPGETQYHVISRAGHFRIEKDNSLAPRLPDLTSTVADTYGGKDKSVLEKDIQDLIAKLPKPTKEDILQKQVAGADLIIVGTIQGVREVHFVNSLEKSQPEIDQLLAEGKLPGLVLTDYTIVVDQVLSDKHLAYPRFFPDYKPLEPGQTIIVMRQGGTYKGVTKIEEAGPAFVVGSQEVLFLVGASLKNYDLPDDGQERFSTESRTGRLLIGPDGTLTAFTTREVGGLYSGQHIDQLAQDIAEFLKQHPFK